MYIWTKSIFTVQSRPFGRIQNYVYTSSKWTDFFVNLDKRPFRQSKMTVVGSNFGPSKSTVVECNFGLSKIRLLTKITIVDRNFGLSKITVVDRHFKPFFLVVQMDDIYL